MIITIIQCLLLILDIYVFLELICKLFAMDLYSAMDLYRRAGRLPNTAINEWIIGILTALIIFLNTIKS